MKSYNAHIQALSQQLTINTIATYKRLYAQNMRYICYCVMIILQQFTMSPGQYGSIFYNVCIHALPCKRTRSPI